MSIVSTDVTIPFEMSVLFRKKVASALDLRMSDLPQDDDEFIQLVLNHMGFQFSILDQVTGECIDLTQFVSDESPNTVETHQTVEETPDTQ